MNTEYSTSYQKDIKKVINPALREKIKQAILSVKEATMKRDIPNLRKLKGHEVHYRIKVGRYRIGVTIENDLVTFEVFDHRKDFYKHFP